MSVATKNPFALLDDDEPATSVAPTTAVAPVTPAPAATRGTERGVNAGRGGRAPRRGKAEDGFSTANPNEPGLRFDRTEGTGRGRRGGRGARRGTEFAPRGRRGFDKHSQTGQTDSTKAVAQGWGAETGDAELNAEVEGEKDAKTEAAAPVETGWGDEPDPGAAVSEWANGVAPAAAEDAATPAIKPIPEEEEDNTLTYEEFLAKKKAEDNSAVPKLEGRQVESNESQWKDAVQLLRETTEEAYFAGKTKNAPKEKGRREKELLSWEGGFERPQRGDGEFRRGGRGGDRGGRGRGGDRRGGDRGGRGRGVRATPGARGGRGGSTPAVNVDDQAAFPSLS